MPRKSEENESNLSGSDLEDGEEEQDPEEDEEEAEENEELEEDESEQEGDDELSGTESVKYLQTIAADEDSIADPADVILKQISDLPVSKIGRFKQDAVGLHTIVEQVQKIKKSTTFNNYQDIASATTELSMKSEFIASFEELLKVAEFIIQIHQVYSVKLNSKSTDENDSLLVETIRNAIRKYKNIFRTVELFTNLLELVYFNVVRKEEPIKSMRPNQKFAQDVIVFTALYEKAKPLSGSSLFMWWFPHQIQLVIELLFKGKPLDEDVGGLLSLIMFACVGSDEDEYFKKNIISSLFLSKPHSLSKLHTNIWIESQQNLSVLLFGITVDDVSKLSKSLSRYQS
jgi:hypothetical protein